MARKIYPPILNQLVALRGDVERMAAKDDVESSDEVQDTLQTALERRFARRSAR